MDSVRYVITLYLPSPSEEFERYILEGPFESKAEAHSRWRTLFNKHPSARVEALRQGDE